MILISACLNINFILFSKTSEFYDQINLCQKFYCDDYYILNITFWCFILNTVNQYRLQNLKKILQSFVTWSNFKIIHCIWNCFFLFNRANLISFILSNFWWSVIVLYLNFMVLLNKYLCKKCFFYQTINIEMFNEPWVSSWL